MKKFSEEAQQAMTRLAGPRLSTESERLPERDRRVDYLWRLMVECFGHRLTSQWGDEPPATWQAELAKLDDRDFRRGVDEMLARGGQWPPSLPEFKRMCLLDRSDGAAVAASMPESRMLPEPPEAQEKRKRAANHWISVAYETLGVSRDPTRRQGRPADARQEPTERTEGARPTPRHRDNNDDTPAPGGVSGAGFAEDR